ncbi:hypothetical protein KSF_066750 [Reticulibacter mediterranei]|uniref:Type IV secretion system coupling protein TraD DNA-binding domain-containing protein n=1 Tax=Reticulibacter mediterranei TaxID=2778369 RepID=A0A8J3ITQ8_9CHLR|nr:hypothetical protein [Reticulibacter mediterranei]GHO96627.1 hypothetical protein KSF_066750 [Reticulibacter mediterranei]
MKQPSPLPAPPLAVHIIPHPGGEVQGLHTLETLIQTIAVTGGVIGLEIAHTSQGPHFLVRTTSAATLQQVMRHLQARFPQATLRPLASEDDPLRLGENEEVSAVELCSGGAAYESLRSWSSRDLQSPGSDPMLSLLAVGASLPPHFRLVAQLALQPVSAGWTHKYTRLALEHPLEQERIRRREALAQDRRRRDPGWGAIIALGLLVILLTAWRYGPLAHMLPAWIPGALGEVVHGRLPLLTNQQRSEAELAGLLLLGVLISVIGMSHLSSRLLHGSPRLYDQRKVAEKLSKSAYRARLRLYVIETRPTLSPNMQTISPLAHVNQQFMSWINRWAGGQKTRWVQRLFRCCALVLRHLNPRGLVSTSFLETLALVQRLRAALQRRQLHHTLQAELVAAYQQYQTATAYFRTCRPYGWQAHRWLQEASGWTRGMRQASLYLTGEEAALLWHPMSGTALVETVGLEQRQERTILAPGIVAAGDGWKLGVSEHAGKQADVFFPFEELSRHIFIAGRTGKGKSTLFEHLALAQLHHPSRPQPGLCVIEPHGDLTNAILQAIPADRCDEVTLIDLSQQTAPIGLNMLDARAFTHKTSSDDVRMEALVSAILTTLRGIWANSWGSRIENVLRYSLKALLEANMTQIQQNQGTGAEQQYTLLDIVPLLNLQAFRRQVLSLVSDPYVLEWWRTYYERLDTLHQQDLITPVVTKISAYASSPLVRRIIGQPCSTLDLAGLVAHGETLLMNTASGVVGREISSLLGATVLSLFHMALAEQLGIAEADRRRFLVFVDEFRNYPVDYGYGLTELRKAGLSLVLAAQSLAQLDAFDPTLRPLVMGNADHHFYFTLSGEDAFLLRHEIAVRPEDVVALPDYTCYAKWSRYGKRLPIFSFQLARPFPGDERTATLIRSRSQQRYGRPEAHIDAAIQRAYQQHYPNTSRQQHGNTLHKGMPSNQSASPPSPSQSAASMMPGKKVRTRKKPEPGTNQIQTGSSQSLLQAHEEDQARQNETPSPLLP